MVMKKCFDDESIVVFESNIYYVGLNEVVKLKSLMQFIKYRA